MCKDLNDELNANRDEIAMIEGGRLAVLKARNAELRKQIALKVTGLVEGDFICTESGKRFRVVGVQAEPLEGERYAIGLLGQEYIDGEPESGWHNINEKYWKEEPKNAD